MDNMHAHHDPCVPFGKLLDVLVHGHLCFFQDKFALHFQLHGLDLAQLLLAFQTCRHQNVCVCVIFPSDVDVLLCKSEGAEDATCQTELLINGFPGQGHIRETSALSASWCTLWLGFRFASCMHAVHGHVHENFSDNHRPARALLDCWLGVGGATASCCRFCSWSRTRAMGSGACTVLTAGSAMDITRTALRGSKLVCMDISFSCCHNSFSSISTDTR